MNFPELNDWKTTSWSLHQASMLIGPIQNAVFARRKNFLHLPQYIEPTGLVSQTLPKGGHIHVDYKDGSIRYVNNTGEIVRLPFADHTQLSLFEALLAALKQDELADFYADVKADTLVEGLIKKLHADKSRIEFLKYEDVAHTDSLAVNMQTASDYADVLYGVFTAVARFRGRLEGHMTPIVVWPEHFDLSTLWFHPDNAEMKDSEPHINVGFAPYTPGLFEFPYIYAYAYPYPESFDAPTLPDPAFFSKEGFHGAVVKYEDLVGKENVIQHIEDLCFGIFDGLYGLIK